MKSYVGLERELESWTRDHLTYSLHFQGARARSGPHPGRLGSRSVKLCRMRDIVY